MYLNINFILLKNYNQVKLTLNLNNLTLHL